MVNNLLSRFAAESGPSVHIAPGGLFQVHGYTITNSMVFAWLCSALIIAVLVTVARRMTLRPKAGFTQIVEIGTDFITGVLENSLGDRDKALKYAPYFVTIFFFIALSNILGLLPGVGEALTYHGTPVFRAFTADLNGTLAAAVISMLLIQYFAIRESGPIKHLRHYFAGKLWNPLTYLIGVYEVFNELIRVFSLALRLFLNIAIGEIIISVFSYLGKFAAPLTSFPFLFLELGVALLQAYIFVMLSVTYLSLAITHGHDEAEELESAVEGEQA
ncbi:MAG TPA: F0F1 ATP synthase subunit A [Candidatus Saccharimonadales bacterium]|nr:F0F1 ATP synthase subunit A [Candidatus Saccharimonadales bacterium]